MPANLPPDYYSAEKEYRTAQTPARKIECLEKMLRIMPKHKGTDKLRADLRRRMSKHRVESRSKKAAGKREAAFSIVREGAGQVLAVGPANTGKSSLVAATTNALPEVADFPFSTWKPLPGMVDVLDIQIQLVDTPPLDVERVEPALLDLIRRTDLVLLVVDVGTDPVGQFEKSLAILEAHRITAHCRTALHAEAERPFVALPFLVLAHKNDSGESDENVAILREFIGAEWACVSASSRTGRNLEELKKALFERLEIIRVYSKLRGKAADMSAPFVLHRGATVGDFAQKVHNDFLLKLKSAKVWGTGVFDGQPVTRDHQLHDGDIVELHM